MSFNTKQICVFIIVVVVGFVLGRLAFRAFLNMLIGGSLFGGNFL